MIAWMRVICFIASLLSFDVSASNHVTFVDIGTAEIGGIYHSIGNMLCRMLHECANNRYDCATQATLGSLFNVKALRMENLDFSFIQKSDWAYYAYKGEAAFSKIGSIEKMRLVMPLYTEKIALVVRKTSSLQTFDDIKSSTISIGPSGSGTNGTARLLIKAANFEVSDFFSVKEMKIEDQAEALCNGMIDVAFYMSGHPNSEIEAAGALCEIRLLSFEDGFLRQFIGSNTNYYLETIAADTYRASGGDISTVGVIAGLYTYYEEKGFVVYDVTRTLMLNLPEMKAAYPAILDQQSIIKMSKISPIPLHSAARECYDSLP